MDNLEHSTEEPEAHEVVPKEATTKPEKKGHPLRTKIILYILGIAILLITGMVIGIRFSFFIQTSVIHVYQLLTWLILLLIVLVIVAIPIFFKLRKYHKKKEKHSS